MSKYVETLEAIKELFSDTSVSKQETIANLRGLRDEIDLLISVLEGEGE